MRWLLALCRILPKEPTPEERVRDALTKISKASYGQGITLNGIDIHRVAKSAKWEELEYARQSLKFLADSFSPGQMTLNGVDIGATAADGLK